MSPSYELSPQTGVEADLYFDVLAHTASQGGTWTAATSRQGQLAFLNLDTEQVHDTDEPDYGDIWGVALSASGQTALTIAAPARHSHRQYDDRFLGVWDISRAEQVTRYSYHPGCYHFTSTPDLNLGAGYHHGQISWRCPLENTSLGTVNSLQKMDVWKLALSEDGNLCASATPHDVVIWDVGALKPVAQIKLPKKNLFSKKRMIGSLHFAKKHLYYGSNDGQVWRTDISGGNFENVVDTGHKLWVLAMDIHEPSGLAALMLWGGRLELWDLNPRRLETVLDSHHDDQVTDVRIKGDLSRIVTTGKDGFARAWSLHKN